MKNPEIIPQLYASTFISGLQEPIEKLLIEQLKDVKIKGLFDGLVLYQTNSKLEQIRSLRFFNNTFVVIKLFPKIYAKKALTSMLISVSRIKKLEPSIKRYLKGKKSFRIICSKENEMIPIEKKYLYSIENKIVKQYNLYLNIYKPEHEFWFLQRREGIGFFMLRLTKNKNKNIFKGQLRSELAYILCYLSEPNKEDIFLDPFAGYNSIPQERNKFQYYKNIIANEKDRKKIKFLEKIFRNQNINGKIMQEDALNMNSISAGSISKIVTDPPWGLYQQLNTSITKFYDSMINEFYRILKNNGICVVLTARKEEFEKVLEKYKTRFEIIKKYDILVSGKKTAVYKLLKN